MLGNEAWPYSLDVLQTEVLENLMVWEDEAEQEVRLGHWMARRDTIGNGHSGPDQECGEGTL